MLSVLLIVLVGSVQFCTSQAVPKIQIETTYQYHEDVIPDTVSLRCTPSLTGNCAKRITLLQLSKDHKPIASLSGNNEVTYGRLQKSRVKAEGRIDGKVSDSFLSVTLSDLMKQDSGVYTCSVTYLNQFSYEEHETDDDIVQIEAQDVQDVVRHLVRKVSFLETKVVDQGAQLQTQERQTNQLVEKSHLNYVFLAGYEDRGRLKKGDTLQFPDVKLNTGDAFDKYTGVFTAPVDGVYYFHLFITIDTGGAQVEANIVVNKERVATLYTYDKMYHEQSSAGTSVILQAGQTVKCSVYQVYSHGRLYSFPYTGFSGHLVKPL